MNHALPFHIVGNTILIQEEFWNHVNNALSINPDPADVMSYVHFPSLLATQNPFAKNHAKIASTIVNFKNLQTNHYENVYLTIEIIRLIHVLARISLMARPSKQFKKYYTYNRYPKTYPYG